MNIKKLSVVLICVLCLAGCGKTEEAPLVMVDSEEDVVSFNLIPVTYDDVLKVGKIDCTYVQTNSQEVSFNQTGKYVDKVYVKEGEKEERIEEHSPMDVVRNIVMAVLFIPVPILLIYLVVSM